MTDYGAGHGSPWHPEPWHPDDPLYGDQGWDGGRRQDGGWDPLTDDPLHSTGQYPAGQYPADPYATGQYPAGEYPTGQYNPTGQYSTGEYPTGQYPTGEYPAGQYGTGEYGTGEYPQAQPGQQYAAQDPTAQQYAADPYATQQFPTGQFPRQAQPQQPQAPQWDTGGWDVQTPYADQGTGQGYLADPYAAAGPAPAATGPHPGTDPYAAGPGGAGQDGWDQDGWSGQPFPEQAPHAQGRPVPPPRRTPPVAERTDEWNPFEDDEDGPETHPFFTRGSDADDTDEERERRRPRDRDDLDDPDDLDGPRKYGKARRGETRRRGGCACLAVVVLLGGTVTGGGYVGYRYYEAHYAPPPDYRGSGAGNTQVEIPDSSTLAQIGNILKRGGVVKSVDAFTRAAADNPKGSSIQGGIYLLRRQMSAAAAVTMMLDPTAQSVLTIPEGWRATQVYQALDKRLGLSAGATQQVARNGGLGLPPYDTGGDPEGFLYPSRYSAAKGGKAADVLRQMVRRAEAEYSQDGLQAGAAAVGRTPYQIIVIASLIQAEAQEPQDFGKVSRVIYNRLDQDMALGFDSTINYAKGRSTLHTTTADTQFASPYNTYLHKGLPPGPIDNPGHQAIEAALHPTDGDWLYFVTVKPGDTRFTASAAQHERNVEAFNRYQQEHGG